MGYLAHSELHTESHEKNGALLCQMINKLFRPRLCACADCTITDCDYVSRHGNSQKNNTLANISESPRQQA